MSRFVWIAFALGCGIIGVSLLASLVHELTSERITRELEIAEPRPSERRAEVSSEQVA